MTEAETKKALEDETKIGAVLGAITEVFRRRYTALIPKALAFLDHENETFRARAIASYFNFMPETAIKDVSRAFRMLKGDESSMVRGAASGALSSFFMPSARDLVSPSLFSDMLRAMAEALRSEEDDRTRSHIFGSFWSLSQQSHAPPPLDLPVDDVDWAFVESVLAMAEAAMKKGKK